VGSLQKMTHRDPATMQPGLHGSQRHTEDLRDLLIGDVLDVVKDEDRPEVFRDLQEGLLDVHGLGRGLSHVSGCGTRFLGESLLGSALAPPQGVVAGFGGYPVEPRAASGVSSEGGELPQGGEERVLGCVAGVFGLSKHPQTQVVDPLVVSSNELFEG